MVSLIYPLYYLGVSWAISVIYWRKQWLRRQKIAHAEPVNGPAPLS
jgi:hypothetical protein